MDLLRCKIINFNSVIIYYPLTVRRIIHFWCSQQTVKLEEKGKKEVYSQTVVRTGKFAKKEPKYFHVMLAKSILILILILIWRKDLSTQGLFFSIKESFIYTWEKQGISERCQNLVLHYNISCWCFFWNNVNTSEHWQLPRHQSRNNKMKRCLEQLRLEQKRGKVLDLNKKETL